MYRKDGINARSSKSGKDSCIACLDELQPSQPHFKAPCGHMYCKECGVNLVASYTSREPFYPLRCCNIPIPQNQVQPILSSAQFDELQQRDKEYRTPVRRRVYCPNTSCKQFIKVGKIASYMFVIGKIKCPTCASLICTKCKQLAHNRGKCGGERVSTIKFEALVKKKGWQRCQKCYRVVEKTGGCSHMTCVCGYEFCYRCGTGFRGRTCKHFPRWFLGTIFSWLLMLSFTCTCIISGETSPNIELGECVWRCQVICPLATDTYQLVSAALCSDTS